MMRGRLMRRCVGEHSLAYDGTLLSDTAPEPR